MTCLQHRYNVLTTPLQHAYNAVNGINSYNDNNGNMKLLLQRTAREESYTIGRLYVDGKYFCDTLEDTDRGLYSKMSDEEIAAIKVPGQTAIPVGTYRVTLDIVSPKYSTSAFMLEHANGARVPRLLGVPGFDGILIHTGNTAADTDGCILVGMNTAVGHVTDSRNTFQRLYPILQQATTTIMITVV